MSENKDNNKKNDGTITTTLNGMNDGSPQVGLMAQYVKDLSFENPNAPNSFQGESEPAVDLGVSVNAKRIGEDVYEVTLAIKAEAKCDDKVSFVVELLYAGLFAIRGLREEMLEPFLVIEAPMLLFPFARRVVADMTRDGGFIPMMLDPIDFAALWEQQKKAQTGEKPSASA